LAADPAGYSLLGLTFSALLISLATYSLVRRRISPQLYLISILIGVASAAVSAVPGIVSTMAEIMGTQYVISSVSITSSLLLLSLALYLFYRIDRLTDKVMKLTAMISSTRAVQKTNDKEVKEE
jgi:hypothetical protein